MKLNIVKWWKIVRLKLGWSTTIKMCFKSLPDGSLPGDYSREWESWKKRPSHLWSSSRAFTEDLGLRPGTDGVKGSVMYLGADPGWALKVSNKICSKIDWKPIKRSSNQSKILSLSRFRQAVIYIDSVGSGRWKHVALVSFSNPAAHEMSWTFRYPAFFSPSMYRVIFVPRLNISPPPPVRQPAL